MLQRNMHASRLNVRAQQASATRLGRRAYGTHNLSSAPFNGRRAPAEAHTPAQRPPDTGLV
jgi:hypothetical protein